MKKTYQKPTMAINFVETQTLISTSTPNVSINSSQSVDAASVEVKGNSTSYDVWSDDWSK